MTFSYSTSPMAVGDRVRLLIPDRIADEAIFSNEEITALLDFNDGNVNFSVADALETIATDEALVQKVIKIGDLQTNGAQTAKVLLDRANSIRQRALDSADVNTSDLFDWAENPVDKFTRTELAVKDMQRAGLVDWWLP